MDDAVRPVPVRLPIIRLRRQAFGTTVVAAYADHLIVGRSMRSPWISPRMLEGGEEADLLAQLRSIRRVNLKEISSVRVSSGWHGLARFDLRTSGGRSVRFKLPRIQSDLLAHYLSTQCPLDYRIRSEAGQDSIPRLVGVALLTLGVCLVPMGALALLDGAFAAFLLVSGPGALMIAAGVYLRRRPSSPDGIQPAQEKSAPSAVPRRTSSSPGGPVPFRSVPLGWVLKLAGLAYAVAVVIYGQQISQWLAPLDTNSAARAWLLICAVAPLLIYTGHRLSLRPYTPSAEGGSKPPILFLRPFDDDGTTTLQPWGLVSAIAGLRSDLGQPTTHASVSPGRIRPGELLVAVNPLGLLRMAIGFGSTTAEESLARFFARRGPVIAIGKPGERLRTAGAERMYVRDDEWREAVLSEIGRAQIVLVQPGASEGVGWELEQLRQRVDPRRVLLSLVRCWQNPEEFERLAHVTRVSMGIELPRQIPFLERPVFIYFDAQWQAHVQEVSHKTPLVWPFATDATDLAYSLRPFLQALDGGETQPPLAARWVRGPASLAAKIAGGVLGVSISLMPFLAMRYATGVRAAALDRGAVAQARPIVLSGISVPYRIEVPGVLVAKASPSQFIEHWRLTPDSRFEMQIVSTPEPEDLSQLLASRIARNLEDKVTIQSSSSRTVLRNGLEWVDAELTALAQGVLVRETTRATNTPYGAVVLIVHVAEIGGSAALYGPMAREMLDSFRMAAPAEPPPPPR